MEMYKISGWTEYELGASMMIAGFVLLTVWLLWERRKIKDDLQFAEFELEEDKSLGDEIFEEQEAKNKALKGQIAHLTKQAIIYKKAKKSAAGKKGIETIKRRGRNK